MERTESGEPPGHSNQVNARIAINIVLVIAAPTLHAFWSAEPTPARAQSWFSDLSPTRRESPAEVNAEKRKCDDPPRRGRPFWLLPIFGRPCGCDDGRGQRASSEREPLPIHHQLRRCMCPTRRTSSAEVARSQCVLPALGFQLDCPCSNGGHRRTSQLPVRSGLQVDALIDRCRLAA
jgi:hypothetical protein